jgi:hypothetical protein
VGPRRSCSGALARAELYDTSIQHGAGDDPDGLYITFTVYGDEFTID